MGSRSEAETLLFRIRLLLAGFIVGLVLSGVTAFPLPQEAAYLAHRLGADGPAPHSALAEWISRVSGGLDVANARYPFLLYGTDWLAFAHLVIALAFVGPYRDPVRNVWTVQWGLVACVGVLPLALFCGLFREIPLFWRLIDCSFGVVGAVPLNVCLKMTRKLERLGSRSHRAMGERALSTSSRIAGS